MASTDVNPFPTKGKAYRAEFMIVDNTGAPVTGATGLDCQVSKDGAAFAAATNGETEVGNGWYYCDLTSTEMTANTVIAVLKSSTAGALTAHILVHPVELVEQEAAVVYGPAPGLESCLGWLMARYVNKVTQTSTDTTIFNAANNAILMNGEISDDGTTFTRGGVG